MKVYLEEGQIVSGFAIDLTVEASRTTLRLRSIPDGADLKFWNPETELWYDVSWDWDLPRTDPHYSHLFYDDGTGKEGY